MFYALTRPGLLDLLTAAEGLLAATGHKVKPCPTERRIEHRLREEPLLSTAALPNVTGPAARRPSATPGSPLVTTS